MANVSSWPNNQDEYQGAEDVMKWLHGRTSGVFAADDNAAVTAVQNSMAVNVSDGLGWMANANKDGIVWWNETEKTSGSKLQLTIDAADGTLNRIDRVIVEWKTTDYADRPEIKVLKGTAVSTAAAPALTNNSTVRQISLAQVSIAAGTTAITPTMITDERLNNSVCGLVTESVTADTSMINAQYLDALEQLRSAINQAWGGELSDGVVTEPKIADDAVIARTIADGVVTRAKLAQDALVSSLKFFSGNSYTIAAEDIGCTIMNSYTSGDDNEKTVNLTYDVSHSLPMGTVIAVARPEANVTKISFGENVCVGIPGNSNWLTAPTVSISNRFSTVALTLKSLGTKDYWFLTGDVEVVT